MTSQRTRTRQAKMRREAVVWIDHERAVIVGQTPDGHASVALLDRLPAEAEEAFGLRTVDEMVDEDRVVVSGPAHARTGFERAYVAMTHRPDRLVDVEPTTSGAPRLRRTA